MKKLMFFISALFAGVCVEAATGIGAKNVETIVLHESGFVLVDIAGGAVVTSCSATATARFVLSKTSVHHERMYAGILAAQRADSKVNFYYDGCQQVNGTPLPLVTNVYFFK